MTRVVVDTNWLISFMISKQESDLQIIFTNPEIDVIYSEELIREFVTKIYLPKFRKYFEIEYALAFINSFVKRSVFVQVKSAINICRDAKDNYLLALSKDLQPIF